MVGKSLEFCVSRLEYGLWSFSFEGIRFVNAKRKAANLVYRLAYNGDVVAFKMGRRQGARREHISIDT